MGFWLAAGDYFGQQCFPFAGRPLAQLEISGGAETWKLLTTDHLGTPILATDAAGGPLWQGGFEPFGADYSGAAAAGVFLRFPGQWEDDIWGDASLGVGVYYNVFRWYQPEPGRYSRVDPAGLAGGVNLYLYAFSAPTLLSDLFGLYCTTDFIRHYFKGNGQPVDLGKVGLRNNFTK